MNSDTIKQKEERYLDILRRWVLVTATTLLVLTVICIVIGCIKYVTGSIKSSSSFSLPSQSKLIDDTQPIAYLSNNTEGSLGSDSQGTIPVNYGIDKLEGSQKTISQLEVIPSNSQNINECYQSMKTNILKIFDAFESTPKQNFNFNTYFDSIIKSILVNIEEPTSSDRLKVAKALDTYYSTLSSFCVSEKADLARHQEILSKLFGSILDDRFIVNQLKVTIRDAKNDYEKSKIDGIADKALANLAFITAGSLFFTFLILMLIFVFIKIELNLREIALKTN